MRWFDTLPSTWTDILAAKWQERPFKVVAQCAESRGVVWPGNWLASKMSNCEMWFVWMNRLYVNIKFTANCQMLLVHLVMGRGYLPLSLRSAVDVTPIKAYELVLLMLSFLNNNGILTNLKFCRKIINANIFVEWKIKYCFNDCK